MQLTSTYKKLIERTKEVIEATDWSNKQSYGNWLAQTYYFVRHSTRLLALSAACCSQDDSEYHWRLVEHTSEEKGHEIQALQDLKALGFQLTDFSEEHPTAAFYQTQYYQIQHVDPLAFFGYILCLEGLAVEAGEFIYDTAKSSHGAKCTRFLKLHVGEDPDHLEKAFASIASIEPSRLRNVEVSMTLSFYFYDQILKSIGVNNSLRQKSA